MEGGSRTGYTFFTYFPFAGLEGYFSPALHKNVFKTGSVKFVGSGI